MKTIHKIWLTAAILCIAVLLGVIYKIATDKPQHNITDPGPDAVVRYPIDPLEGFTISPDTGIVIKPNN
jgi:hypothetical protein